MGPPEELSVWLPPSAVVFTLCWACISHRSHLFCPTKSFEPCLCSAWASQFFAHDATVLEDPGPNQWAKILLQKGGCSEAEQQQVDFRMGVSGEASWCPLQYTDSWLGRSWCLGLALQGGQLHLLQLLLVLHASNNHLKGKTNRSWGS